MENPDIAVIITTFNQKKFIEQCINSVLEQKTSSSITVYVHDDCSTDGTQNVIKEIARDCPDKIVPILSEFNKLSNGKSPILDMVRFVDEEFIAFCNGDDYWTDEKKLERQLDLLIKNPQAGLVHTAFKVLNEKIPDAKPESEHLHVRQNRSQLRDANDFVTGCLAKESSVMIRRSKINFDFLAGADHLIASDYILYLSIALNSDIIFLNDETLVHRYVEKGVYNGASDQIRKQLKYDVLWYAASKCPKDELRWEFQKRVSEDFILTLIKRKPIFRLLLKISEPFRHPSRLVNKVSAKLR